MELFALYNLNLVLTGSRVVEFRKGGCFGLGTAAIISLSVSISTTSAMDGLRATEACVQRSPMRRTLEASPAGKSSPKQGSTTLASSFDL